MQSWELGLSDEGFRVEYKPQTVRVTGLGFRIYRAYEVKPLRFRVINGALGFRACPLCVLPKPPPNPASMHGLRNRAAEVLDMVQKR